MIVASLVALLILVLAIAAGVYHRRQTSLNIAVILTAARAHAIETMQNPAAFRGGPTEQMEALERNAQALRSYSLALAGIGGFLTQDLGEAAHRYVEFLADLARRLANVGSSQREAEVRTREYVDALLAVKTSNHMTRQETLRVLENATRQLYRAREQAFQECRMLKIVLDEHALLQERVSAMISAEVVVPREQLVPFEYDLKAALVARDQARKTLPQ